MNTRIPELRDYTSSRAAFGAAAEQRGATLTHYLHPLAGPDGGPVVTDIARVGPPPAATRRVVAVASGTHGVEGHGGSGLQRLILEDPRLDALPADVAVVFIHAVNPYGMAWSRRVDHDNIDVNRNFVDFEAPLPTNRRYERIDAVLNPGGDTFDLGDQSWVGELMGFADEVGMAQLFATVTGGQYDRPSGMQFGGATPSWSRATLETVWAEQFHGAEGVIHLDVHTGLGPRGQLTVFQTADADEAAATIGASVFPDVLRADRGGSDEVHHGVLGVGFDAVVGDTTVTVPLVLEFGTHDDMVVLGAMRADNWLHNHGDPTSASGRSIRASTRDAFYLDDVDWRTTVAETGLASFHAALDAVTHLVPSTRVHRAGVAHRDRWPEDPMDRPVVAR